MEFYDDPHFQRAATEATRLANRTGDEQRIFRCYGMYCVRASANPYEGTHIALVQPDKAKL